VLLQKIYEGAHLRQKQAERSAQRARASLGNSLAGPLSVLSGQPWSRSRWACIFAVVWREAGGLSTMLRNAPVFNRPNSFLRSLAAMLPANPRRSPGMAVWTSIKT
jgi:hypothetical protein